MTAHPTDNLVRLRYEGDAVELRSAEDGGDGRSLFGHFAVFNDWTEINSMFEGRFLERIVPGAFRAAFENRDRMPKVLFDHGHDPSIGNKPLGTIKELREDRTGAFYEVGLLDAPYVDELLPALREGLLGASFRFKVTDEAWSEPTRSSSRNPDKIPERSITGIDLFEFGPVTFPAYANASAGVRSSTDDFLARFNDPMFVARFTDRAGLRITEQLLASLPTDGRRDADHDDVPGDPGSESISAQAQARAIVRARHALISS